MEIKKFESSKENVTKYVFHFDGKGIAEAVLYRYPTYKERTVVCLSVQSGCPVGCQFCGTGKNFIRNLTAGEIVKQATYTLGDIPQDDMKECKKLQIMFMSMGEPFLNYQEFKKALAFLNDVFPHAELLVSTIAPNRRQELNDFLFQSMYRDQVGLQFSLHETVDEIRNWLIPYQNKLSILEMRDYGVEWARVTGRRAFINYCVKEANSTQEDADRLTLMFPPTAFNMTLSVICSPDETMKDAGFRDLKTIQGFSSKLVEKGFNVRTFDPAGQDDIGGGCGQLWYVQRYLKGEI